MTEFDQSSSRIHALLANAVANLNPTDRAERIAYCRRTGEHGVRMSSNDADDLLTFVWGGQPLAMIHRDVLDGDGPVRAEFIGEVPDSPAALGDDVS